MASTTYEDSCKCGSGKSAATCCALLAPNILIQRARTAIVAQRWDEARAIYRGLLANPGDEREARQELSEIALRLGDFGDALTHLDKLCSLGCGTPIIHMHRGVALQRQGRHDAAKAAYLKAIELDPSLAEAQHLLGTVYRESGALIQAQQAFEAALLLNPDMVGAANDLACIMLRDNKIEEAIVLLRRALASQPQYADGHNNLGNALKKAGNHVEAASAYRDALRIAPAFAEAHNNLALLLSEMGNSTAAKFHYEQALRFRPNYMEAHYNLANLLDDHERLDEAVAHYSSAIRSAPEFVPAYNNLGLIFLKQKKIQGAIACFEKALTIQPEYVQAANNLAKAYRAASNLDAAEAALRKVISLDANFTEAYVNLGNVLWDQGGIVESNTYYERALQLAHASLLVEPIDTPLYKMFTVVFSNYFYTLQFRAQSDWEAHRRAAQNFQLLFEKPLESRRFTHSRTLNGTNPIRIAYLSSDFRTHSVAKFFEPLLQYHDREKYTVYCYYTGDIFDGTTERIRSYADVWCSCTALSDAELADKIHGDKIDILVDLAGHTSGNRLLALAMKPAPVQITYLGYPGSTWLGAMDYRITDSFADPIGTEDRYSEALLRMPHSMWCFNAVNMQVIPTALPALKNGYVTFGSFNIYRKIDDDCIALWSALLHSVPSARLLIVTIPEGKIAETLLTRFKCAGIPKSRIEIRGQLDHEAFLAAIREVDIALDPVNINGATTTCEALHAGVPTLNLVGDRFLTRAGLSILTAAGVGEFALTSQQAFIAFASELANDLPRLALYREKLLHTFGATPLTDVSMFTRNFEYLLRDAWIKWCDAPDECPSPDSSDPGLLKA